MVQMSIHIPCKRYRSKMSLKLDEINHPKNKTTESFKLLRIEI